MALYPRLTVAFVAALAVLAGSVVLAGPAAAEDGYRYWGYYHLTGDRWKASTKGADGYAARDGDVEGFRFATTTGTMPTRPPRATPTFQDICAGTGAAQGEKRVGIVLDYGTAQDASGGDTPSPAEAACAVVPADASTQQALESVRPLRIEQGLICAIDGYPSSGCAEQVANVSVPRSERPVDLRLPTEDRQASGDQQPAADQQASASSIPWPLVAVAALVLLLAAGAVLLSRRRA